MFLIVVSGVLSFGASRCLAQDTTPAPPAQQPAAVDASTSSPVVADAPAPAATMSAPEGNAPPVAAVASQEPAAAAPTAQTSTATNPSSSVATKKAAAAPEKKGKKEKEVYTGPTEIIVKEPTPMLDEEGKQRLDPDGKPMFNPGIKQQRDKKGHPLFEDGKPVFQTKTELGYDEHGKKLHVEKEKPPKMTPMNISRGTFTVDGVIGKAELNYDIADLKYLYMWVPGMGVTIVSNQPFPGAKEQKAAFSEKTLTITVNDHQLQIASDKRMLSKKPQSAFVVVNRDFVLPSRYPVVGYGATTKAPYSWPGSKANAVLASIAPPPPTPTSLKPVLLLKPCPTGQMRMPAPPVLPGQVAPEQPCVLIAKVQAAQAAMKAKAAATAKTTSATSSPAATTPAPAPASPAPVVSQN